MAIWAEAPYGTPRRSPILRGPSPRHVACDTDWPGTRAFLRHRDAVLRRMGRRTGLVPVFRTTVTSPRPIMLIHREMAIIMATLRDNRPVTRGARGHVGGTATDQW